jgi:hypothetical protein
MYTCIYICIYVYIYIYIYIYIYTCIIHTYIHIHNIHSHTYIYIYIGVEIESRSQVVSRLWKYIKEHNLQDPNAKKFIDLDANMTAVFDTDRFSMFDMNRSLNSHLSNIPVADSK